MRDSQGPEIGEDGNELGMNTEFFYFNLDCFAIDKYQKRKLNFSKLSRIFSPPHAHSGSRSVFYPCKIRYRGNSSQRKQMGPARRTRPKRLYLAQIAF